MGNRTLPAARLIAGALTIPARTQVANSRRTPGYENHPTLSEAYKVAALDAVNKLNTLSRVEQA